MRLRIYQVQTPGQAEVPIMTRPGGMVRPTHRAAVVHVDGQKAGAIRFPAGEIDQTALCKPGSKHVLSLHVIAMPLKGVLLSYSEARKTTSRYTTVRETAKRA